MTVREFLIWYKKASKKYAERFLAKWQKEARICGEIPGEVIKKFIDLYPRGKQLRGALAVLGYQVAGGKDLQEILKASIAMELMETSILIADDVFDRDRIRRGIPTIHCQWEKLATNYKLQATSAKHFAYSMAHITAIVGFHLIPLIVSETKFSTEAKGKALNFYCRSLIQTGFGEAMDISSSYQSIKEKQSCSQKIHDTKTVWYSAILPLSFGTILAGKQEGKWLDDLGAYAQALGRVFQTQDDVIGSFGDPKKTGKSNTSDIADGRWTVLVEILWKKAGKNDRQKLKQVLEKKKRGFKEVKVVKSLMVKYGVVELARKQAGRYLEQGLAVVPRITKNKEYQEILRNLLEFMLKRAK